MEKKLEVTSREREVGGKWGKGYYGIMWNHEGETFKNCDTQSYRI